MIMSVPLLALLVEDSEDDAFLLTEALRRAGFDLEFERVDTADKLRAALAARPWDIILCDYIMPGFDAPAALQIAHEFNPDLPVIVVSGMVGEDIAVATIKLGAVDYLMKDRLTRLGQAIGQALEQRRLRAERKLAVQALHESELKFAAVFREAPVWIVISDAATSVVAIHRAGCCSRSLRLIDIGASPAGVAAAYLTRPSWVNRSRRLFQRAARRDPSFP